MLERLTTPESIEQARSRIEQMLDERGEWFYTSRQSDAKRVSKSEAAGALRKGEWELRAAHGSLLLSLLTDAGARVWRIVAWEWTGERLVFEATRRMRREHATIELIPRASVGAERALLLEARRALCERLAALAAAQHPSAKLETVALSRGARRGEPGRYARILLSTRDARIAVTGAVVEEGAHDADALLTSALIWLARLREATRERRPLRLHLVAAPGTTRALSERLALLREELRSLVSVYETDEARQSLSRALAPTLDELLACAPRFSPPTETSLSRTAQEIIALAPDAIDALRVRQGETLRFHGLPFARVRRLLGREQVWFGVEAATRSGTTGDALPASVGRGASPRRRLLDATNRAEFLKLVADLAEHRRADADNKRHAFYRAAPEAWLESILRRDITRLDPGLRLSPLHTQFRTSRTSLSGASRPIDLLALRHDGRLVVVELKVSEDAALPLQGADYWRRISAHQRAGHVKLARLFGDAEISDDPPLVYLVAPMLSFHRAFPALARCINPRIELYRFDINEDWRAGVRVARRGRVGVINEGMLEG
ncbi:MAG TPA: hypothetical protein VGB73_14810 [Pyrinomonadaceae bacterium]|jgi:hypothetical protein